MNKTRYFSYTKPLCVIIKRMKRIYILLILILTIQYSFGQACGIYRIKYIGNIKSESLKVEKIKLPTIEFLNGIENEQTEKSFIEIEINNYQINAEISSKLTSNLYSKAESLLKFYQENRNSISIIVIVIENGTKREILKEFSWNNIQISKLEDDKFGNLFELNLNKINLDNNNSLKKYPWDDIVTKIAIDGSKKLLRQLLG